MCFLSVIISSNSSFVKARWERYVASQGSKTNEWHKLNGKLSSMVRFFLFCFFFKLTAHDLMWTQTGTEVYPIILLASSSERRCNSFRCLRRTKALWKLALHIEHAKSSGQAVKVLWPGPLGARKFIIQLVLSLFLCIIKYRREKALTTILLFCFYGSPKVALKPAKWTALTWMFYAHKVFLLACPTYPAYQPIQSILKR